MSSIQVVQCGRASYCHCSAHSQGRCTEYAKYLYDMVSPIQKAYPDKFKLYSTKESKELYIHSKLVIIDDVYVSLGLANWNRRSVTSDTEIGRTRSLSSRPKTSR
ncbi:unnamed protein product [Peronospora belbahrii]|nr:unnamed protein product [Peronospora belbahrii]